jgi:2,5-dihydroxypyridine 5,6-dioxygenase
VDNYVRAWCHVQEGDHVLVLADDRVHPQVAELVRETARAAGAASVVVAWIDYNPVPYQGGGPIVDAALRATDKLLLMTKNLSHDSGTVDAMRECGMSFFMVTSPADPGFFATPGARFPFDLMRAIALRFEARVKQGRRLHFVMPQGTDFWLEMTPEAWHAQPTWSLDGPPRGTGPSVFPGGICGGIPVPGSASGVCVYDSYTSIGVCADPLRVHYRDGWLTEIEGGQEARALEALLEGVENARYVAKLMIGLNPKARIALHMEPFPSEAERHAGHVHIGVGNTRLSGGSVYSRLHTSGDLVRPTVYIDDELLIDRGHLLVLDDPEVREVASRFGDPDELLHEVG